jgi:hypothetical protein
MNFAPHSSRRCRGGLLMKLLLVLAVIFAATALVWTMVLPSVVTSTIRSKTGFAVQVDKLSVNPLTAQVHISGLVLENPPNWPEKSFVSLREFRADAELLPLLRGKLVADEVVLDVAQLTLVKDRNGVLNAIAFKEALAGKPAPAPVGEPAAPPPEFLIRRMVVKFDRLTYADHAGASPLVREYNLGINRELRDVDSVADLVSPFSGPALVVVADVVGGLFKDSSKALQDAAGMLKDAGGALKDGGKKAGESLKGFIQQLEKKKP